MQTKVVNVSGSLRRRLALILIAGVTLLTLLLFLVVRNYAAQIALSGQDSILNASVTSMLDAATMSNGIVEMDIPYASFSMLNTDSDDRIFYAIYQGETLLSGYKDLNIVKLKQGDSKLFQSTFYKDVPVRQITASRILSDANLRTIVSISVAQTQDELSGTLDGISRTAALYGVGFFSLAVFFSVWATSTTIRPLTRIANSIARRGPQDLSPVAKAVPSEMAPLVSSLNHLMARLDTSFRQSEDFIAEAAHRVRTPIATVRSHAETTLHRVDKEENRHALRAMIRAIDETSRAAGQLLDHAMVTFRSNQLEFHNLDLVESVKELIQSVTPIADMKDISLVLETHGTAKISGDPILIQNAVRNLIDNALKYSPAESQITVKIQLKPVVCIQVEDQGPGFPNDEINTLTNRFVRGENASGIIGSGLGLTIARDVAAAHGGQLEIKNLANGGACVTFIV